MTPSQPFPGEADKTLTGNLILHSGLCDVLRALATTQNLSGLFD